MSPDGFSPVPSSTGPPGTISGPPGVFTGPPGVFVETLFSMYSPGDGTALPIAIMPNTKTNANINAKNPVHFIDELCFFKAFTSACSALKTFFAIFIFLSDNTQLIL